MSTRWIAVTTVVAQVVFVASWLIAAAWQVPAYSPVAHTISDMYAVTAPRGLFLVVVLTICGLVTIAFALFALRPALRAGGWAGTVGAILLALSIFGLGDALSPWERLACQLADPDCGPDDQLANLGGKLDTALSTIGLSILIAAAFFLAAAMDRAPGWKPWAWPTRAVAIAVILLLVGIGVFPAVGGLLERLIALTGAAWIAAVAVVAAAAQVAATKERRVQAEPR